jgi:hypothetical protein
LAYNPGHFVLYYLSPFWCLLSAFLNNGILPGKEAFCI